MDWQGQKRVESVMQILLAVFAAAAFVAGYAIGSFQTMMLVYAAGVVLTVLVTVPNWPFFNLHPLKWLDPSEADLHPRPQPAPVAGSKKKGSKIHQNRGHCSISAARFARFKRLKGCARVAGDDEEDDVDDLENEFSFKGRERHDMQYMAEVMLQGQMRYGRGSDVDMPQVVQTILSVSLLTNGQMVDDIPPEQHALVPSFMGGGGKRIHHLPFSDPGLPVNSRSMDPSKDLAAYGYGSVAWKERMEQWKQKQEKMQVTRNENGGRDWDNDGDDPEVPL